MAKKRRTSKKKSQTRRYKRKPKPKHTEDFKLIVSLCLVIIIIIMLGKTDSVSDNGYNAIIKDVSPEQIGDSSTYTFYYTVENPTNMQLDCDVIVEISGKPYINRVVLKPKQELYTKTNVEMPNGESSIKITADCE